MGLRRADVRTNETSVQTATSARIKAGTTTVKDPDALLRGGCATASKGDDARTANAHTPRTTACSNARGTSPTY